MRSISKYKIFSKSISIIKRSSLPLKLLQFHRTKWKKIQKFFSKTTLFRVRRSDKSSKKLQYKQKFKFIKFQSKHKLSKFKSKFLIKKNYKRNIKKLIFSNLDYLFSRSFSSVI